MSWLSVLFSRTLLFVLVVAAYLYVWEAAGPKQVGDKPDLELEELKKWSLGVAGVTTVLLLVRGVRPVLALALCALAVGVVPFKMEIDVVKMVCVGAFLLCFHGPWLRRSNRDSMPRLRLKPMEAEIRELYMRHNPAKLSGVDDLLLRYRGREEELYDRIVERYEGPGRSPQSPPSPPQRPPLSFSRHDLSPDEDDEAEVRGFGGGGGAFGGGAFGGGGSNFGRGSSDFGGGGGGSFGDERGNPAGGQQQQYGGQEIQHAKQSYHDQMQERIRLRLGGARR